MWKWRQSELESLAELRRQSVIVADMKRRKSGSRDCAFILPASSSPLTSTAAKLLNHSHLHKTVSSDLSAVNPSFCFCPPFSIFFLRDLWKLTSWIRHCHKVLSVLKDHCGIISLSKNQLKSHSLQWPRPETTLFFQLYPSHNIIYHLVTIRVLHREIQSIGNPERETDRERETGREKEKETQSQRDRERISYRNRLKWLWRPRGPTVCCLKTREPGKLMV